MQPAARPYRGYGVILQAMADQLITREPVSASTLILAMNRPDKRNALSIAMIEGLTAALRDAAADRARRVVILRGEGPVFCAGLDLKEAADPSVAHRSAEALARLYETICTSPLVIIAAAQGSAMGGGAGFISAADFVIASDDLQVGYPEVRRGIVAALVMPLLRRQVPERTTREIILLGQTLDANRCRELGLVNRIATTDGLRDAALALAAEVVTGAPDVIVRTKQLLNEIATRPIREDLQIALAQHVASRTSPEMAEGIAAFREKRPPNWGSRSGG